MLAAGLVGLGVGLVELDLVDLLAREQRGVAAVGDLHLLHHLAADHFDVLVVDLHALETIDVLDLLDEIGRQLLHALDAQDVVGRRIALDDVVALLDVIALAHADVLALGDQVLGRLDLVRLGLDDDAALVLVVLAELDEAVGLGEHRALLGLARLEQLRHARQAARDVARLGAFRRDTRQQVAGLDVRALVHRQDRVDRQRIARLAAVRQLDGLARLVDDDERGTQLGRLGARARAAVDDDAVGHARLLVRHLLHRDARDDLLELHDAVGVGEHRQAVRVPFRQPVAALDRGTLVDLQARAVDDTVGGALLALGVGDDELHVAAHRHQLAVGVLHDVAVHDLDLAVIGRLDLGRARDLRRTADMERAHGELRARLADRLGGDDADRLADIDRRSAREIAPVALAADALGKIAGQDRAHAHLLHLRLLDLLREILADLLVALDEHLARLRMLDVLRRGAAEDALAERRDDLAAIDLGLDGDTLLGAAILRRDDAVVRHVDQTAGQVTRIRRLERGVGQTLAGAVGRVEVLEHGEAFLEVRQDRRLDDRAVRTRHEAAHAGELLHLLRRAAGAGMAHHVDRVHLRHAARLRIDARLGDLLHHFRRDQVGALRPVVDDLVVLLFVRGQAVLILLLALAHLVARLLDQLLLRRRDHHVVLAERDAGLARLAEAQPHHRVSEEHRLLLAAMAVDLVDDVRHLLLAQELVDQLERDLGMTRQDLRDHHPARRGFDAAGDRLALGVDGLVARRDLGVQRHRVREQGMLDLADVVEHHALARLALALLAEIVEAENDVLRRHDDRLAVRGAEDVVGRHHQHARFQLRLEAQRHVHGHLVAVEVGIEGGADQRMQLDRLALDQHRLERLDAEAMQRRRAIEQHRMLADHLFEDVPDLRLLLLDQLLGLLDRLAEALRLEPRVDERLEQLERHLLGQAALVQLELRTDHDHRTARIVDALAEQVLAEAALLALQHVGERLQRTLVGPGDDAAAAAVVEQGVDRLLQHALLVAHDDVGRLELDQALEAVVAVDDAAIEVVQVRRREAAAVQRHERAQLRRDHRHDGQDHPFRAIAGIDEGLDDLEPLDELLRLLAAVAARDLDAQVVAQLLQVDRLQQHADGLGADHGGEGVVAVIVLRLVELVLAEQLAVLERREPRLGDDVVLEIEDALEILQRHVEHEADAARQRLQEPDVGDRRRQLDMRHAVAAHLLHRDLDAALLADDALVFHALVLAAQALVILHRPEDARAEQPVALRLEGAVVDRLGLLHLAVRPAQDLVGAGERDLDPVEGGDVLRLEDIHQLLVHFRAFLQLQFGPPSPFDKLRMKALFRHSLILSLSKDEGFAGVTSSVR